jgi:hypothetical protein
MNSFKNGREKQPPACELSVAGKATLQFPQVIRRAILVRKSAGIEARRHTL